MQGFGVNPESELDSTYYNEQLLHTTIKTWHSYIYLYNIYIYIFKMSHNVILQPGVQGNLTPKFSSV